MKKFLIGFVVLISGCCIPDTHEDKRSACCDAPCDSAMTCPGICCNDPQNEEYLKGEHCKNACCQPLKK